MNKIDVLFIGGSFPTPSAGGSVNYVYRLLNSDSALTYAVFTSDEDPSQNAEFDLKFNRKVVRSKFCTHVLHKKRKKHINRVFDWIIATFQAFFYILKSRPKLVYFTEFSPLWVSYIFARLFINFRLGVFTYAEEITITKDNPKYKWLLKKGFVDSDIIITVCEYTRNIIDSITNVDDKIFKIIPSIVVSSYNKNNNDDDKLRILTVARLEKRKGHIDVINALLKLPDISKVEYHIVGGGPYEDFIRKYVDKVGANSFVRFLGRVSDEDLVREYSHADIFAMPHKQLSNGDTEGCPTVFLEAGLYYLPVIGGAAGGVSDAILDNVTGFICHSETELEKNIMKLVNDKTLRHIMGEAGYKYASQFTAENQSKEFWRLTKEVLEK